MDNNWLSSPSFHIISICYGPDRSEDIRKSNTSSVLVIVRQILQEFKSTSQNLDRNYVQILLLVFLFYINNNISGCWEIFLEPFISTFLVNGLLKCRRLVDWSPSKPHTPPLESTSSPCKGCCQSIDDTWGGMLSFHHKVDQTTSHIEAEHLAAVKGSRSLSARQNLQIQTSYYPAHQKSTSILVDCPPWQMMTKALTEFNNYWCCCHN